MAITKRNIVKTATVGVKGAAFCIAALAASQAHARATDINSCVTITKPGSYILADDIVYGGPANGACIKIMVSKVSINLDGHTMSWPGPASAQSGPAAIEAASDTEHATVKNGFISGFGSGVLLFGTGSTVKDVHVGGPCPCNGIGIEAVGVIRDNVVNVSGVHGGSAGISAKGVVEGNYVYDARFLGMTIGANSTVRGNTVTGTSGIGMQVICPSTVAHNTVTGSSGENIALLGAGCTVRDNTAP